MSADTPETSFSVESLLGDLLSGKHLDLAVRKNDPERSEATPEISPTITTVDEEAQSSSSKSPDVPPRPPSRRPHEAVAIQVSEGSSVPQAEFPKMPPIYPASSFPQSIRMPVDNSLSSVYSPFLPAFGPMIPNYVQNHLYMSGNFPYSSGPHTSINGPPTQLIDSTVLSSCFTGFPPMKITVKRNIFKVPIQKQPQKQRKQKKPQHFQF